MISVPTEKGKRTMALRKQHLMYRQFGHCDGHTCGECSNLVEGRYHDKILRKCKVYGMTHSEASDWAKRWLACGMFNKTYTGGPIIQLVRRNANRPPQAPEEPLDGQMSWEV